MTGLELAEAIVGGAIVLAWEAWLGKTNRVKSASTFELVINIARWVWRRMAARPARAQGAIGMSIESRTIQVSESAEKIIGWVEEMGCDLVDGKPRAELLENVANALQILPEGSELRADYDADPEAVENAVMLATRKLARRLIAALKARKSAAQA